MYMVIANIAATAGKTMNAMIVAWYEPVWS
jgi:hypothetical protein